MKKYTLEELIEKDMIMIPEPDMTFMLGELKGKNFMGLHHAGGVYLMIHEPTDQVIYVGVSRGLGERLSKHKARRKGSLRSKISGALGDAEADKQINNEIKVQIISESKENYQELYELILIEKYDPVYNIEGKQGGRGSTKGNGAINLPIKELKEKYLAGKSTYALGKEYGVSRETIISRLNDVGVPIRDSGGHTLELPIKELKEKYLAGKSTYALGKEYGVSAPTISKRLKDAGIDMRGSGGYNKVDLPEQEIKEKYLAGKTAKELGKEYEVTFATIGNRLKGAGVKLHSNVIKRKQLNAHLINTVEPAGE